VYGMLKAPPMKGKHDRFRFFLYFKFLIYFLDYFDVFISKINFKK
jgi:hypothetical protein